MPTYGNAAINETMARRFFPDQDPLGKLVQLDLGGGEPGGFRVVEEAHAREIVGVVRDFRAFLASEPRPTLYVPYKQHMWVFPSLGSANSVARGELLARAASRPLALEPVVAKIIAEIDPDQAPSLITTQEQFLFDSIQYWRFWMRLFSFFGAVALTLVVVGIFGVVASAVSERTHEMGLRMAIGAQKSDVFALVIKQGVKVTLIGLGIGIAISLGLSRLLSGQILLYEVNPIDPFTYTLASLLLLGIALAACYLPALWATRVNPVVALKYE